MCFLCFPRVTTPWITQWRLYDVENCCKTSIRESVSQNTNARHLFFGAIIIFCFVFQFGALFLVICSFGTKICNLLHFGPKISHSHAIRSILEQKKSFLDGTCSILDLGRLLVWKKRSILEPAFARYCLHHVYNNLKSHIRMVLVSFWCNNMEFAWYLLQNESCSNCYLIVFYLDDSTTAAAYWHFLGFL